MKKCFVNNMCVLLSIVLLLVNIPMSGMEVLANDDTMLNLLESENTSNEATKELSDETQVSVSEDNSSGKQGEIVLPVVGEEDAKEKSLMDSAKLNDKPEKKETKATAKVLKHFIQYDDSEEVAVTAKKNTFSAMAVSDDVYVKENEIKVLNDLNNEEKDTYASLLFIPETTAYYTITTSGEEVPYIYIYDSNNNSLGYNRTYPQESNSLARKLNKGEIYTISLSSISTTSPTELLVKKYKSNQTDLTYTFVDSTYTQEDKASVVVTVPNLATDLLYGILDRDILIEAELLKDGELIDTIPEIPQGCIRGATGTPDDNILQFMCEFSKIVDYGEYTIRITCKDAEGKIVIDSCESNIMVGNPAFIYMPSNSLSYSGGQKNVFFNYVNTSNGKFAVLDDDKVIGVSSQVSVGRISVDYDDLFSYYSMTSHNYETAKFSKTLNYSRINDVTFNETLEVDKVYDIRFVAGVSEYETTAKLIATDSLILNGVSTSSSLYDTSTNLYVNTQFYNMNNVNPDDIYLELVDLSGNVVASQVDYTYYQFGEIYHNLRINTPLDPSKKYSIKINYSGQMYVNATSMYISAYSGGDYLSLRSPTVLDSEKAIISVPTYECDTTLEYDVVLYRENNGLSIPISQILKAKANENSTFILEFPRNLQDGGMPLLTSGASYKIVFTYKRHSYEDYTSTNSVSFSMPSQSNSVNVDSSVSFYPPVLPSTGETEFTISGYEIENGIMGTDNKNINIELIADDEIYGVINKDTIKKNASVYNANSNYTTSKITITGIMEISKSLKDDAQYYIRINGTDYKYFYNSHDEIVKGYSCKMEHCCSASSFKNSSGNYSTVYNLSNKEALKLNSSWIRETSGDLSLVMINNDTKKEIEAGTWNTTKTYFDGEYKDISITADLSGISQDVIYEIGLKAGEKVYSLNKYIKIVEPVEASYFSVKEAVYGSDIVTVAISTCNAVYGYSFDIKDSLDNVNSCSLIPDSIRQGSNNLTYMDLKTYAPLKYATYIFRMYNADNVFKNSSTYTVSKQSSYPTVQYIQQGLPYLIHGQNFAEEGIYTADIIDYNNYETTVKKDVPLLKKSGENILELDESTLDGLPFTYYKAAIKLNGKVIGIVYFEYSSSLKLKPLVLAKEWVDSTNISPNISSNNVELLIKTMYYTKVRYSEDLENLQKINYQSVTNSIYYEFESASKEKNLYLQFADDYQKESEIITFKAYLKDATNDITILSPEANKSYSGDLTISANVSNEPSSVWAIIYGLNSNSTYYYNSGGVELVREEGTDCYSKVIPSSTVNNMAKVEICSVDEVGNITNSQSVVFKELIVPTPAPTTPEISFANYAYYSKKSNVTISGRNATPDSEVIISVCVRYYNRYYNYYYYNTIYSQKVIANQEGEFEGTLNIAGDGNYYIYASDSKGISSGYCGLTVDTIAPVLKDYSTVAQGINSVRISWDVTDANGCNYTIWKDGKLLEAQYSSKEYLAIGLTKGETYVYKVIATDYTGNQSEPVEIAVTVGDAEVPNAPKNIKVSSRAGKSITLSWDAATDNSYVAGYEIYRNNEKVGTSYKTTFADVKLTTGVEYSYKIRAFDPTMNYSDFSESVVLAPSVTSIKDAYDGSNSVVASTIKNLTLKALTSDILNNVSVVFAYSKDQGTTWNNIAYAYDYTTTPKGLLFSAMWNIQYYETGEYIIRYTASDRDGCTSQGFSSPITIQKTDDFTKPTILYMNPLPSCYGNQIPLNIGAEDNIELSNITLQGSMDGINWNDIVSTSLSNTTEYTWNYDLNVSNIREGDYYIRAIATDAGENQSSAYTNKYIIDRTAPEKLEGITSYSYSDCIELRWNVNSEPYIGGFRILRSDSIDGVYSVLASNVVALNYFDTSLQSGKTYYYKVICIDVADNLSQPSEAVEAKRLDVDSGSTGDNVLPVITSLNPQNKTVVSSKLTVAVNAEDNVRLSKITTEYSADNTVWKELKTANSVYSSDGFTAELDTSSFTSGTVINIRAHAVDINGNVGNYEYRDYMLDNVPPKAPIVNVIAADRGLDVTWSCNEEDIETYKVCRRISTSQFYTVVGEFSNSTFEVLDENLDPEYKYIYKVIVIDKLGNTSFAESKAISPLDIDKEAPTASINSVSSAVIDTKVEFDGSGSKDNVKIAKYEWNMGDGTTYSGINATHTYTKEGTYNVVLGVTDSSGNQDIAVKSINIIRKGTEGTLNVSVVDNLGKVLPFADVYINVGEDSQYKKTSDSLGQISLELEAGTYNIGVYKEGYEAKQQEVLIQKSKTNNLKFVLGQSELVVGSMTATKMTLEEIKKAGIDVTAPGNQNVFRYQINLQYNNKPYTITYVPSSSGPTAPRTYPVGDKVVEVRTIGSTRAPVVVILEIPGAVSWLKDFFDVKLHLVNTQGSYDINNCVVKLNAPNGLSIVGDNGKTIDIGTLPSNGSKDINWIVRGDKTGSYKLSADFSGLLESFNEAISAKFTTSNPIVVSDTSGLKLKIEVENEKYSDDVLYYRVGFENGGSTDVNRPKISMQKSTSLRSYKTTESMSVVNTSLEVLKPGEILWTEFSVDPEMFGENDDVFLKLKEYAAEALNGLSMPIEIKSVNYGTFGRVKPEIFVIDPITGEEISVDVIELVKYISKVDDVMPTLKIKAVRGISEDVVVTEVCELTIDDNLFGVVQKITTDNNGEYIYKGGSIDKIVVGSTGVSNFNIMVSSENGIKSIQSVRIVDQALLPKDIEAKFIDVSPKELSINSNSKVVYVIGTGFNVNIKPSIYIENSDTGLKTAISNVSVKSSTQIEISIPNTVNVIGVYNLIIDYKELGSKTFDKAFILNNKPAGVSGTIESGLLIIEGNIIEIKKDEMYEVDGTATINKFVKYEGTNLVIDKKNGLVSGDGIIYIPVNILGYAGKRIDIKDGKFSIKTTGQVHIGDGDDLGTIIEFMQMEGCLLQYQGLPINIDEIGIIDGGVEIKGGVQLGDNFEKVFGTDGSLKGFVADIDSLKITYEGIDLKGTFTVGSNMGLITLIPGILKLEDAKLTVDTEEEEMGVSAKFDIGKFFASIYGEVGIKSGELDKLILKYSPPNPVPIGTTGFGFASFGGGVDNLSKGFSNAKFLLITDIQDVLTPPLDGNHLINFNDLTLAVSLRSVGGSGKLQLYCYEIASSSFELSADTGFYAGFEFNLLDIFRGDGEVKKPLEEGVTGHLTGKITIPDFVPIVGGESIAETTGELKEDCIKVTSKLGPISVATKFTFDPKHLYINDFKVFSHSENDSLYRGETDKGAYEIGTNMKVINSVDILKNSQNYSALSTDKTYSFSIQNDQECVMLNYKWDRENPNIKVIKPDGTEYHLIKGTYNSEDCNWIENQDNKKGYIFLVNPENGNWKLEYDNGGFELNVVYSLLDAKINAFDASKITDKKYKFSWDTEYSDDVEIYMNDNKGHFVGRQLAKDLPSTGEITLEIPDSVGTGEYYFYIKANREDAGSDYEYADLLANYVDNLAPEVPVNFTVDSISNGKVAVSWDNTESSKATGYFITNNKTNGKKEYLVEVAPTETSTIISSLSYDTEYNLGIVAYSVTDSVYGTVYHYSPMSNTHTIVVKTPVPPEITFEIVPVVGGKITEQVYNEEENLLYHYINSDKAQLNITTDCPATTYIYVNDVLVESSDKSIINKVVNLTRGMNNIRILSIANNGDEGVYEYEIYSDIIAPELYIYSPMNGETVDGNSVVITGRGEYGADLKINNQSVTMDNAGHFEYSLPLDYIVNKIKIQSTDVCGNYTSCEVYVQRKIEDITKVAIDLDNTILSVGETKAIKLVMEDTSGNVINAPEESVSWNVVEGVNNVSIKDGYINAIMPGTVVIKAELNTGDNSCMESELVNINIIDNSQIEITPTPTPTATPTLEPTVIPTITPTATATPTPTPTKTKKKSGGGGGFIPEITTTPTPTSTPEVIDDKIPKGEQVILTDVVNHWASKYINELVNDKIVNGYPDMTYRPENSITRAEAAVIIIKMLGLTPMENTATSFSDDVDIPVWAKGYINKAVNEGIINGYKDKTFKASNTITRAEMSVMIIKALKEEVAESELTFADSDQIAKWATGFVGKAYELKLISGYPDNTFKSNNGITRAEVSVIVAKALNHLKVLQRTVN